MKWSRTLLLLGLLACLAGCSSGAPSVSAARAAAFDTTACPVDLGRVDDVVAPPATEDGLIAAGEHPSGALICEYGADPADGDRVSRRLAHQLRLAAAPASELATAAALVDVQPTDARGGCPADVGRVTVIAFARRDAPPLDLWWHSTGCQTLDNGARRAVQVGNESFGRFQAVFADVTRAAS